MSSSNPVSPKTVAAGIGSALLPVVMYIVAVLLENLTLIEGLPPWAYGIGATIGAVIGGYVKTDGLRLPTLDKAQVEALPDPVE